MDFGASNDNLRQHFNVALAVNGSRESNAKKKLMRGTDLTWDHLSNKLKARHLVGESEYTITGTRKDIKKIEVDNLRI